MGEAFRSPTYADRDAMTGALERARRLSERSGTTLKADDVPAPDPIAQIDLASKARAVLAGRRARDRLFGGSGLFGEPAWDIMLDLFVAQAAGQRVSISSAAAAAYGAPTTALRWIDKLIQLGLLEREADHLDRRRHFVRLSERAEELVRLAIVMS